jgi:hypothetical protein
VLKQLNQLDGSPHHEDVQAQIFGRYRELMQIKDRDTELYELKLKQAKVADAAIELWNRYRMALRNETENAEDIKSQMREKIREKFNLELQERKLRIGRLTDQLNNQKKMLAADEKDIDNKIDERVRALTPPRFRGGPMRPRTQRAAQGDSPQ